MPKFTTCLWFDDQAEEAAKYYVSIFKKSKIIGTARYGEASSKASGRPAGSVMTVEFDLGGQRFVALNGGPHFKFTEAISLVVNCRTQKEVDYYWTKLSAGGKESCCGWLKDKFGLSWQVVPTYVFDKLRSKDPRMSERAMEAVLQMGKIDLKTVKKACAGK